MKILFFFTLLSLAGTIFAETENCQVNKKFKGTGALSERLSVDGKFKEVVLNIRVPYIDNQGYETWSNWQGVVARKDLSGTYVDFEVRPEHQFSVRSSQKLRGLRLDSEYFNPGYKRIKSKMLINENQDLKSINVNETIYNDYQQVEAKNSLNCNF